MNLHVRQFGSGPEVVLLHGWGLHSGVFDDLAQRLSTDYRVTLIDLPGHGRSRPSQRTLNLASLAEIVADAAPHRAAWMGWSLGGMIAMQLALTAPARVSKLILINGSPRFITAGDWPCAMDPIVLAGFAESLQVDYRGTLERFLSLQVAPNSSEGRAALRRLREILLQFPSPGAAALNEGLTILRSADLRPQLAAVACPVLVLLGERDRLVPACVGPAIGKLLPAAQVEIIKGAGHAPFLSNEQTFLSTLSNFLEYGHD